MGDFQKHFFDLLAMIIGVAIIAVLVSQSAQTSNVMQAFGSMMGTLLNAATSPVTGSANNSNNGFGGL